MIIEVLALPLCWITPNFLHPWFFLATASAWSSASDIEMESNSFNCCGREPGEVTLTLRFSEHEPEPSLRVAYRDLVLMTKLFTTQLPISEGDQR